MFLRKLVSQDALKHTHTHTHRKEKKSLHGQVPFRNIAVDRVFANSKMHMLKSDPQWAGIRTWGLQEVIGT